MLEHHPNRPLPHLGGVLLCLSHDSNLSQVEVSGKPGAIHKKIGAAAGVDPVFELDKVLGILKKQQLVDISPNGVEVLGLTSNAVLQHSADIFSAVTPNSRELATITMAELCTEHPHSEKELRDELSDKHKLSSKEIKSLLEDNSFIGFSDFEDVGGTRLYFNGSLFRRNEIEKAHRVLSALTPDEVRKVAEVDQILSNHACVTQAELVRITGPVLMEKLVSVGMYEFNEVKNSAERVVYVTKAASFCKFGDTADAFDMAKALVAALTYGMSRSSAARGRITMVDKLLSKLINGEWVGPAPAIGEDYRILEVKKVIQVKRDRRGFSMRLLKKDIGKIALAAITQGEASEHSLNLSGAAINSYKGPEEMRHDIRRSMSPSESNLADILQSLRAGGSK